jgi:rubrerythrin
MSVIHALSLAIELELKASDAYRRLSGLVVDGVVKNNLLTLSQEEVVHANTLRVGKNHADSQPEAFESERISEEELTDNIALIDDLLKNLDDKGIGFEDALKRIRDLESRFERAHLNTLLEVKDPSLKQLFTALSSGDQEHAWRVGELVRTLFGQS